MKKIIFTIVCSLIAFYTTAQQIRYVKQGGVGNGSSWANASGNLQAMINASSSGSEVWVAEGTYQPVSGQFFSMKQGVRIYGGFPNNNNSANMNNRNWSQNQTILLGNGRSVIRNVFTSSTRMTSISVLDGFVITGNNIQVSDTGAGIFNQYASPMFRNLIIRNNRSQVNGGGVFNKDYSSPTFLNVLIANNRSANGGGVYNEYSSPEFINSTVVNNVINGNGAGGGFRNAAYSIPKIFNSVVYGNGNSNVANSTGGNAEYRYSLVQGATTNDGNGNINGNTDPLFVDVNSGNFTLSQNSPVIDAGSNLLYIGDLNNDIDLAGNFRLSGGEIDMGAYENQEIYAGPSIIYVKSNAIGNNDGSSWENAYVDLQNAINNSIFGDQIWVAEGTYQRAWGQSFSMKQGVKIYGGFPDNNSADMSDRNWNEFQTILLGNGRSVIRNVFTSSVRMTSLSVLDGFVITGNNVQVSDNGAGIFNQYASPMLVNLAIRNNRSQTNGGGVFNKDYSSPTFLNVLIANNRALNGAGVYNEYSSPEFINSTIVNNLVSGLGGGLRNSAYSIPKVFNSVVYGNGNSNVSNSTGGDAEYRYSLVQGVTTNDGNGNVSGDIDPLFVDVNSGDYRLSVNSSLLNVANNSLYTGDINEDLDLGGIPRLNGATIDMGAYENHGCQDIATWNGISWSQSPTINTQLVINGNLTVSTNLEGCTLTVQSGNVIVNSGQTVTVFNEVNVLGGSFTLRNQASLVQINDVENTGEIVVEKTTKPMNQSNYGYWSSPVEGWRLNELSPLTQAPYFYSWNLNGQSWTQHSGGNHVMQEGRGYIVRAPSTLNLQVHNLAFEGTPNNGDVEINILGGGNFNFLGNPYPSAINIESFLGDPDNSGLDKVVYLWTNGYQVVNGNYVYLYEGFATYNAVGGAGVTQSPTPQMPTAMIASGQAFFITGNQTGTITFKNSHRVVGNNNNSFNRLAFNNKHRFWLNLESDRGYFGQTLIGYLEGASNDKDKDIDAVLLENEASIQIYSLLGDEKTIIQGRALPFDIEDSISLGYIVKNSGTYSVSLPSYEGLFTEQQKDIFIKDNLLNVIHSLKDGKYEFFSEAGTFDNRFEIVYKKSSEIVGDNNDWQVYKKDGQLYIESSVVMEKVSVYDMLGRLVYEANDIDSQNYTISEVQNQQILIIKVFFGNNQNSVKKVKN